MTVQKLLLMKKETTYDTDPTPDGTNAFETIGLTTQRYEGDTVQRDLDRHILGGKQQINVNPHAIAQFGVHAASSGAAGTAPAFGVAFLACGFDETVDAGVDVQYQLPTDQSDLLGSDSVTLWDYRDQAGMVQKVTGVRGACNFAMNRGELPMFNFENLMGTYNRPVAGSMPTGIDWSGWKEPLPVTKANTPTLTLDSVSACTESFQINFGQEVGRRNIPGCQQTLITGYEITGSMKIVAPDIGTKDWFAKVESHAGISEVAFSLQHGNSAGEIITLAASTVQILNIAEDESAEGDLAYSFELSFLDSPILTFK